MKLKIVRHLMQIGRCTKYGFLRMVLSVIYLLLFCKYFFKQNFVILDDYWTARKKAKKAEDTSDLNSDLELAPKRKPIKRKLFQSESSSDEEEASSSNLPPPPKLKFNSVYSSSLKKINQNNTQDTQEAGEACSRSVHSLQMLSVKKKYSSSSRGRITEDEDENPVENNEPTASTKLRGKLLKLNVTCYN